MNKIYKVIWSKAKHTYVVASEIAKGHTKGETTGKGLKKLATAMLVAAALLSPSFAWAADTATVTDTTTSSTVEVYTRDGANNKFATSDQLQKDVSATNEELAKKANQVDLEATNANLAKKANQTDLDATNENLAQKADKATTLEGYGITDAYTKTEADGKFATVDQLQADVAATNEELVKKANAADVYSKTATDNLLAEKANTADVYSKTDADTKFATNDQLQKYVAATNLELANKADKATTLKGYGITDAYTKAEVDKADAKLQTNINNEATARAKEDARLNSEIVNTNKSLNEAATNLSKLNTAVVDGFKALNQADEKEAAARKAADAALDDKITAETSARVAADAKLVEATNGGLSLGDGNVLQTNTTTIDAATGEMTTSKTDAKEMILNKGEDNQITLNEKGIKVGTNSSVMDKDGVYTGGDTYSEAKAALKSDGSIRGADGKFTVNSANGTVNVNNQIELNGATGVVKSNGLNVGDGNFTVNSNGGVKAADGKITLNSDGSVKAANGNTTIDSNGNVKTMGTLSAADGSFKVDSTGKITSTGLDAGNGTIQTTGTVQAGDVKTDTLETTGDATIGGNLTVDKNLTVNGEFNAKTLSSKLDENNYTTINGGKTESMNLKMDKKTGEIQASASTFDETGSNVWARDDDSKGLSTVTADSVKQSISDVGDNPKNYASRELSQNTDNKYEITDSVVEGNQSNVENRTADTTDSQISLKDDSGKVLNKSYITQNLKKVLMGVEEGDNKTTIEQDANNITNTAENGTITNSAKDLVNKASENMTNTVGKDLTTTVGGEMETTVTGKVTEDYKSDLDTKVGGNENHYVKGNQTNTVSGDRTVNVKGTETENFNALVTSIKTDQKTSVGGNQTNIVAGNQSNVVAGNQTNTISGSKTESVKGAVTETYGSQTTKVNGDQNTTVTGKQTNSITGDQVNTIGGNQTTTVTGDSSLSAKNITNTAEGGTIYNKSKDILNEASGDIINWADGEIGNVATKITNITGNNTVTSDTNGTTFENTDKKDTVTFMDEEKSVDTKKTTISGNTITTGEAVMDYADVRKDLGVRGNATIKGDTTMEGNASVGKDLTVNGKSTFNDTVSITKGGLAVTGGTTTDKLHVTGTSQFDGAATFKDIVTMEKDLNVGGNAKVAGDVTAKSFKVEDKTYIDKDGINANNQVIKNVGKGDISHAGSTDAVSGGQLYETNTRVTGLETRMGTVETKVDKLDNKIDKVGANAAAMANLHPLEFDEDSKWNIAAAVGSSGSETASAVGVFYRPNENVMVNASAAMGTGENMFGGGVSLRLGHGGNKAKEAQMKAAVKENRELRAKVEDLTARMDALLSVLNPNMSKDFPDVPENHWAYEAVSRLAGNGIVEGYEDGKYHGERQMTRYEMAEIVYNALSKGAKAEKKLVEEFRPELQAMAAQKKA